MEPERVRPIGRPRREDAREQTALVVARVHLEHVAPSLVEPRDGDELVADADPLERVRDGRLQVDRRIPCLFVALGRRAAARSFSGDRTKPIGFTRYPSGLTAYDSCATRIWLPEVSRNPASTP